MIGSHQEWHEEGARLLEAALALHRNHVAADEMEAMSELPRDMQFLLRVANGEDEALSSALRQTGAQEGEMRQAAIGFIEKLSFSPGTDVYQVLCLNPWAPQEDIKVHYRLLIRLFHPDRGAVPQAAAAEYAARINQAYTALSKGDSVPAAQPSPSSENVAASRTGSSRYFSVQKRVAPASADAGFGLNGLIARLAPQIVLGFVTLTAVILVTDIYLTNRGPTLAPEVGKAGDSKKPGQLLGDLSQPMHAAASSKPLKDISQQKPSEVASIHPLQSNTPKKTQAAAPSPTLASLSSSVGSLPSKAPTVSHELAEDELRQVVAQFIGSYNHGDLEGFMALMSDNIHTDEQGGKAGIRSAYGRLFSGSLAREMVLRNLHWQPKDEGELGLTDYRITVLRPADKAPRLYTGSFRIEVAKLDGQPSITGFYQQSDQK